MCLRESSVKTNKEKNDETHETRRQEQAGIPRRLRTLRQSDGRGPGQVPVRRRRGRPRPLGYALQKPVASGGRALVRIVTIKLRNIEYFHYIISCFISLTHNSTIGIADHLPFHIEAVADRLGKVIDDRLSVRGRQERIGYPLTSLEEIWIKRPSLEPLRGRLKAIEMRRSKRNRAYAGKPRRPKVERTSRKAAKWPQGAASICMA